MLVPLEAFFGPFEPIAGRQVFFAPNPGNVGDYLIESATRQLFRVYGVTVVEDLEAADALVVGGGGSWGNQYSWISERRQATIDTADSLRMPVIVFPQSVRWPDREPVSSAISRFFARERASQVLVPRSELAPDPAMAYTPAHRFSRGVGVGMHLRTGPEALFDCATPKNAGDPTGCIPYVSKQSAVDEYVRLAARYERVVTDRLHFAMAALIAGRHATLLPNVYHKNRSMYETWLKDLGCDWAETPKDAL